MRKHELRFTVHLDDYHSNITAWWPSIQGCVDHVNSERDNGYDVDRITVDGEPLFCTFTLQVGDRTGEPCGAVADFHDGAPKGKCITHAHFEAYQRDRYAYKGD